MVFSQNNKGALRIRKINIRTAINETVEDLKFSEGFNSIKVEVDIKPDFEFQTDQERFKIILNNLISNSIKYRGRNEPFIRISAHIARENLILEIEDNGIGIEEAHIGRIFEMFYRASENTGGSGLGLYIVQEAILRLGGTIKVTSVPMKGTKFTLELSALK
jgi:signal transduction histidine kinase